MAYTTINKSTDYFNTKLYTGNATDDTAITGVGFTPSFLWGKNRTDATNHYFIDAVRGVTKELNSNNNSAEGTDATLIKSFDSDGFTLGDGSLNQSSKEFVSWNWKANGQGSSNTDGSINTTYTSASTTSGFSISTYTGTGANATVGHGLGVAPKMILMKNISTTSSWIVYHESIGNTKSLALDSTAAEDASSVFFNNTSPTSSVFSLGNSNANASGDTCIAYCFAEKTGFSKFGSYIGNGNEDGAFVYTGFKPAFILIRSVSTTNWNMFDNKRSAFNVADETLWSNTTGSESSIGTSYGIDILSNGFKARSTSSQVNFNNTQMVYMAFAAAPLVGSNNIPANAR